jgi:predicted transcriptional regulator with HTH domain
MLTLDDLRETHITALKHVATQKYMEKIGSRYAAECNYLLALGLLDLIHSSSGTFYRLSDHGHRFMRDHAVQA